MTNRARKAATFIALETGGPGVDPSADGSGYVHLPTMGDGSDYLQDETELLETDYEIGRNEPSAPIAGGQGWAYKCRVPLLGLAAAAGDGVTPGANDWLDLLLLHIFGTQVVRDGEGVGSGSTTTTIVADTDVYSVEDLLPIYETGVPAAGPRTQWGHVESDAGTGSYGILPAVTTAPTTAGVVFGHKLYYPDADHRGGDTISLVRREDDGLYLGGMGRIVAAKFVAPARKGAYLDLSFKGTGYASTTKASLPVPTPIVQTQLRGLLSPVNFNGTSYATDSVEIDLGIQAAPLETTDTADGVSNQEQMALRPKAMFSPLYTNALNDLRRNVTQGRALFQVGAGVLSGGVLGTLAVYFGAAHARAVTKKNANGRNRAGIELAANAGGLLGGQARRFVMIARA